MKRINLKSFVNSVLFCFSIVILVEGVAIIAESATEFKNLGDALEILEKEKSNTEQLVHELKKQALSPNEQNEINRKYSGLSSAYNGWIEKLKINLTHYPEYFGSKEYKDKCKKIEERNIAFKEFINELTKPSIEGARPKAFLPDISLNVQFDLNAALNFIQDLFTKSKKEEIKKLESRLEKMKWKKYEDI